MFGLKRGSRAQSIAEYALFFSVAVFAVITMSIYIRRGVQGVIKDAADEVGTQEDSLTEVDEDPIQNSASGSYSESNFQVSVTPGGAQATNVESLSISTSSDETISVSDD